jgi:phosphoribosylformylglycinamidine synthase
VVAEIPAHAIAEEGPRYERAIVAPASPAGAAGPFFEFAAAGADLTENFRALLASPAIASKYWITEQYDSMVRTNTRFGPGASDAAVLRLKETERGLALSTDGNGRWCFLSPRLGAMHSVAEAARNVACSGARPVAATNCLNFGNPEKPEVMWQFSEAVDGIAEACRALEIPVTGGNVSFYNETLGKPIYPTPILGVLGVLEDADFAVGSAFDKEGDAIVLLDGTGEAAAPADDSRAEFSSSEYAKTTQGIVAGVPPAIDLAAEKRLIECLVSLASAGLILSAHDVSDGGLAVTIAESCFASDGLSADVNLTRDAEPSEVALFGERGARAVVSLSAASLARLNAVAAQYGVAANRIGTVTRNEFRIQLNGTPAIRGDVSSFRKAWAESLAAAIESAS